jgi:hypothetical protein
MKKISRLPHEQATGTDTGPEHDGLPVAGDDVEGHRAGFLPGLPGTGGDQVRNAIGKDTLRQATGDEPGAGDDVEGHSFGHTKGERLSPGMPGTGGDSLRRPVAGGEVDSSEV